jgi:hypothetical protein
MALKGPLVYRRAATAVAHCHSLLAKARREMLLAIDILECLDDPSAPWPCDPNDRKASLTALESFLTRLDATQQELSRTWPRATSSHPGVRHPPRLTTESRSASKLPEIPVALSVVPESVSHKHIQLP